MVEFKYARIGLTAVDASKASYEFGLTRSIATTGVAMVLTIARDVCRFVATVVFAAVGRNTCLADPRTTACLLILHAELSERFRLATNIACTQSHRGQRQLNYQRLRCDCGAFTRIRVNAPTKLPRRSLTVTVPAAYIALVDLHPDYFPRLARGESSDLASLGRAISVIELKDENVRLAAVDAWMGKKVVEDSTTILRPICIDARDLSRDVDLTVL